MEEEATADHKPNSVVGAATAGTRALATQLLSFYVRVPVKLFRPTRFDYLVLPRSIDPELHAKPWSIHTHSGPALLVRAVRRHGWSFIPNNVLPPLIANSASGVVLYTTYLTSISVLGTSFASTFYSGAIAGAAQSLAVAPLDAIATRFSISDMQQAQSKTLWAYSYNKLKEIGLRGVFAGYLLSLAKESMSFAVFFSTFEGIKSHGYRTYLHFFPATSEARASRKQKVVFPTFVLLAGLVSAVALQVVQYPLDRIQRLHIARLEALDRTHVGSGSYWKLYWHAYGKTLRQVARRVERDCNGSWVRWLYRGFVRSTLYSVPSTSIGIVVFEIMRLRYTSDSSVEDIFRDELDL